MCCDGCLCFSPTERTRGFLQGLQDPSPPVQASPGGGHRFLHDHRGWDSVARVRFIAQHMIAEALIVRLQVRQGYAYTELDTWEAQGARAARHTLSAPGLSHADGRGAAQTDAPDTCARLPDGRRYSQRPRY